MQAMRILASSLIIGAGLFAAPAFAGCEIPSMVSVPDGATATRDQLLEAQTRVKTYMEEMELYLACINEEIEASGDDATEEFKMMMFSRHDAAVTEMQTLADAYNEQLQAFRAANPDN
jgi:hypothetical protein